MTQPIQPTPRRTSGGFLAHAAAGILLALLYVVLVNMRPFSPWVPAGTTFDFAAEISSSGGCTVQAGRYVFGGLSLLSAGRAQLGHSDSPQRVILKVRAADCEALTFQVTSAGGPLEIRNPRLLDEEGRVLHRYDMAKVQMASKQALAGFAPGMLQLRPTPAAELVFQTGGPIRLPGQMWPGWGVVIVEFLAAAISCGAVCALMARRFPGAGRRFLAKLAAWTESRPRAALLIAATAGVIVSCHPVIFLGRSFVSPNNGAFALYHGYPSLPGDRNTVVKSIAGSDLGAMMWAFLPYSCIQHEALANGEWPLRNRYAGCGLGLQGQGISMFGDPLHLIPIAANGEAWAWDLKFIIARLLFAWGIGLVAFAAVQRAGVAMLLAVSASFIGHFTFRFNHPAHFTLCYSPWVLLPWLHALRANSFRAMLKWMPLHVVASIAVLCSGALKEAVILLGVLNGTALLALLLRPLPWRERIAPAAAMLSSNGILMLVAAPFWMTFLDLLGTARTIYDKPEVFQIQPSLLVGLFEELFPRQLIQNEDHFNPSGNFLLLLGVLWSLVRARVLVREPLWLASALAAAGAVSVAFGVVPPSWIAAMPFFGKIWHVDNCFSLAVVMLTFVLAAFGLRDCLDRRGDPGWRADWVMFAIGLGALFALYFGFTHAAHREGSPPLAIGRSISKSPFFIAYASALAAAVLALPLLWRRNASNGLGVGGWLLAAAAFSTLHFRHAYYGETKFDSYVRSPQPRPDFHAKSPALEKIRASLAASKSPARVIGTMGNFSPDFNAIYGLETPFSCDAVSNRWLWELADAAGFERVWGWRILLTEPEIPALLPVLDMLGVRFLVSHPAAGSRQIPGLESRGSADLAVHESRTHWPRAFFTDCVADYSQPGELIDLVRKSAGIPFAAVQPGAKAAVALKRDAEHFSKRTITPATDYRLTANTTTFSVNTGPAGMVVLGEAFEQGNYSVTVDGAKAEPLRVNHAFLGVLVNSPGKHEIKFTYRPRLWTLSLCTAGAGILLLLSTVIAARLPRFRR